MNQLNLYFLQRGEGSICTNIDMMGLSPSRKDIRILTIQIFDVKTIAKIGKAQQVINEMRSYTLDILGILEMRWTENG